MKMMIVTLTALVGFTAQAKTLYLSCAKAGTSINIQLDSRDCHLLSLEQDQTTVSKLLCETSSDSDSSREEIFVMAQDNGLSTLLRTPIAGAEDSSTSVGNLACLLTVK